MRHTFVSDLVADSVLGGGDVDAEGQGVVPNDIAST